MNVMMIPVPQSLLREIREAIPTTEELESAREALKLTNGNAPQAAGILRKTMSFSRVVAAIHAALGK